MTLLLKMMGLSLVMVALVGSANAADDFDERIRHYKKQIRAVEEEINKIRDMRNFIQYMDEKGTYYQEVACKGEKRAMDYLEKEHDRLLYAEPKEKARLEANKAIEKWNNCVDGQIARNPELKEIGIHNFSTLYQQYTKWNQDFYDEKNPARFYELVQEKEKLERGLRQQQRAKQALNELGR